MSKNSDADNPHESAEAAAQCADCGGEMVRGFIPDQVKYGNMEPFWVPGKPQRTWLRELNFSAVKRHYITALRYNDCDVLKLYAHKKNWRVVP